MRLLAQERAAEEVLLRAGAAGATIPIATTLTASIAAAADAVAEAFATPTFAPAVVPPAARPLLAQQGSVTFSAVQKG